MSKKKLRGEIITVKTRLVSHKKKWFKKEETFERCYMVISSVNLPL